MSDFKQLSDKVWASPQITTADVALARERGFSLIVNNRPEGEADDQTDGEAIAAAAREAGMAYCAIPIEPGRFTAEMVTEMAEALEGAEGPVLAYCRSGTRSTLLWSLVQAARGADPDKVALAAARAGYDISPVMPIMQQLIAARSGG